MTVHNLDFWQLIYLDMLRHYIIISWRNLIRHKFFSFINVLGLSLGLACCCLIALFVQHEFSYDEFHTHGDEIYRLTTSFNNEGVERHISLTPNILLPLLKETYPLDIYSGTRLYFGNSFINNGNDRFKETGLLYADSSFFKIFSFVPVKGNPEKALSSPNHLVITESAGKKYFGNTNPIGRTLRLGADSSLFTVEAVVEDVPANSSFSFEVVLPFQALEMGKRNSFTPANYHTFIRIQDKEKVRHIESLLPELIDRHADKEYSEHTSFHIQGLKEIYFGSGHINADEEIRSGNKGFLTVMISLAMLILLIACFNYINLSTSRSIDRAREVAMRKVIGAQMSQLRWQFLGESALVTLFALGFGLLLCEILLPYFNQLSQRNIETSDMFKPVFLGIILGLGILTGLLAGGYPAMILSKLKPIEMLRGSFRFSEKGSFLRKSLVVAQFSVSVVLLMGVLVVQRQMEFIQNKKLGFDREHVVILPVHWQEYRQAGKLEQSLEQLPFAMHVSRCTESPHEVRGTYSLWPLGEESQQVSVKAIAIDEDFIGSLKLTLAGGENISPVFENEKEETDTYEFLMNEEAIGELGWKIEEAIGQVVNLHNRVGVIKGVVKNFHFASLHQEIGPLVMYSKGFRQTMLVRLAPGNISEQLEQIGTKWDTHIQHQPFEYKFLDSQLSFLYKEEKKIKQLVMSFAILALFIAGIGLMGLVSYMTTQRNKEIGIRKVLGASIANISMLLSKDFIRLIGLAYLLGLPIAYIAMSIWLENFSYRINIGLDTLLLTGAICFGIAWIAMGAQTIKAANANPVDALRQDR